MYYEVQPPDGMHWEPGKCPNAREDGTPVACNCPGYCRGRWVDDSEQSTKAVPSIEWYPCNRGGSTPAGYHHFEMNQYGACCIYCGKQGPAEPMTVTYGSGVSDE